MIGHLGKVDAFARLGRPVEDRRQGQLKRLIAKCCDQFFESRVKLRIGILPPRRANETKDWRDRRRGGGLRQKRGRGGKGGGAVFGIMAE